MARLRIKEKTIKALFARSGNECAFPNCKEKLINDKNQCIGEIVHIESSNPKGPRFNPNSTDEDRRDYKNLMLLCHPHHVEIDDPDSLDEFTTQALLKMKAEHEASSENSNFQINQEALDKLMGEMERYWEEIEQLNKEWHLHFNLAMRVEGKRDFSQLMDDIYESVDGIERLLEFCHESDEQLLNDFHKILKKKQIPPEQFKDIPYYKNPFVNRNWEVHNLGANNCLLKLRIDLTHLEVKFLEASQRSDPDNLDIKTKLEKKKSDLKEYAKTAAHAD